MQTLRGAISDISNDLKSYNLDDRYSFRHLANKLVGKIELFIKQDSSDRGIFKINEIWKPLPCVQLEDASYDICADLYDFCDILKKSKSKIPEVYTGRYGNFIKVMNLNNSNEYKQIKSFEYKDIKRREYVNKKVKYFWVESGYIFIPDTAIEEVRVLALFKNSQEADKFNNKCDDCYRPLDSELLAPDYIVDIAKTAVVNEIIRAKGIVVDEKPNMNSNIKSNP